MRRTDKEITEKNRIEEIIKQSLVCRLALSKNNIPYLVPVSFGYDGTHIYVHTAKEGKKIDYLKENNQVCFEFDINVKTIEHESIPCKWTTSYQSVIGFGIMKEIKDYKEAGYALNQIMLHYSGKEWELSEKMLATVRIWKIKIEEMTGKESAMKI